MRTVFLVGKLEWKKAPGRHRYGWDNNFRMDLREIVWEGVSGSA
jgi:hypothetical protein